MKKNKTASAVKNGSVLILALIMASILLSVGMGISGIAMKEIKLSSIGNESGIAFYTADAGAECALYWDAKNPNSAAGEVVFGTPDTPRNWTASDHYCGWGDIDIMNLDGVPYWSESAPNANPFITTFAFALDVSSQDTCAIVKVVKTKDTTTGVITTEIESRGRSSPCWRVDPRAVERGLKVSY